MIRGLLIFAFLFSLFSCKNSELQSLDKTFGKYQKLISYKHKQSKAAANEIKQSKNDLVHQIRLFPKLEGELTNDIDTAREFFKINGTRLSEWLDRIDNLREQMHKTIFTLSKDSYHLVENNKINKQLTENEILSLYSLLYLEKTNKILIKALLPISLVASNKDFEGDEEIQKFREKITKRYLGLIGYSKVLAGDIETILGNLSYFKKNSLLGRRTIVLLSVIISEKVEQIKNKRSSVKSLKEGLDETQEAYFNQIQEMYSNNREGLSLLYNPEHNLSNPLLKFMVVVSNLTWGGVNSLIGAGVILTAMVVSPFTPYLDFPQITISSNGIQIYADVSGLTPMPGKVSLGLFEISNHASYFYASPHEGGHSVQSAILGPLYLPTVLVSYITEGYYYSSIEILADEWAVY